MGLPLSEVINSRGPRELEEVGVGPLEQEEAGGMKDGAGLSGGGPARTLLASTMCLKVCWKEFTLNDNCWIDVVPYILPWSMGINMILICSLYVTQIGLDQFSNHLTLEH